MTNGCALPREEGGVMFIRAEDIDTAARRENKTIVFPEGLRHILVAGFGILLAAPEAER